MNVKKFILSIVIIICILVLTYFFYMFIMSKNSILEIGGGFETAYVTWNDNSKIFSYNVYIKNIDDDIYEKIDNELIRKYKKDDQEYWRADAIGLQEGEYNFKIVPVVNKKEIFSIITGTIVVKSHVREGFSFAKNSTNGGNASGGYLENGEVPEDAKIVYITKNNVNTVILDITNSNGEKINAIGLADILTKWKEENISKHLIIRIIGKLDRQDVDGLDINNLSILIKDSQDITIEGVGNDATLNGIGILILGSSNIEVRNLGFMLFYEDAISLDKNNNNIWIHNNDIFYGEERDGDKIKGDGSTDIKESKYITVSYNHYWDSGKTSLCGVRDDLDYITYHHNWFDHADSRLPRVRYASVHVYNNFYDGNASYGVGATCNASVFVEGNFFQDCIRPMLISGQGSDFEKYAMSGEDGGMIKAYNNLIEGRYGNVVYSNEDNVQFDAYYAIIRMEKVPEDYKTLKGDSTYNNFDTDSEIMYDYVVNEPSEIMEIVTNNAGRLQGGDIIFNTNELNIFSANRKSKIEYELDHLINNYETSLIYVKID